MKNYLDRLALWLLTIIALLPALCLQAAAQPVPTRAVQARNGAAAVAWLQARLGIREATGRNDGPAVAELIRCGGGEPTQRPAYCGFTQACDQRAHALPIPGGGMQGAARAWFPARRRVGLDSVKVGHLAGFDYGNGTIHHVARVVAFGRPIRRGRPPRLIYTIAGNEGTGTNAGVHLTGYAAGSIAAFANWLY